MVLKPVYRITILMVSAFALGILAGNGVNLHNSRAEGYDGILAPEPGQRRKAGQELPGYKGVIPGYIAPENDAPPQSQPAPQQEAQAPAPEERVPFLAPAPGTAPAATAKMTMKPGSVPPPRVSNVEDIRMAALAKPMRIDWENAEIPPALVDTLSGLLTPQHKEILEKPLYRIQGMLPEEFSTKQKIDSMMAIVGNPSATPQERKANARKATEMLVKHANFLQARKDIPASVFKTMGVPANYEKQEREVVSKSLGRIESAIKDLKKYE